MSTETTAPAEGLKVPRVTRAWYVMCFSSELVDKPLARTLYGEPVVLFRTKEGRAGALVDRCPHRNVPLSFGYVDGERLVCGYHGWAFDQGGACRHVPGLMDVEKGASARQVGHYPVIEQQGCVWMWGDLTHPPDHPPFVFRAAERPGYVTVRREMRAPASVHAVAENALDVPHTAFLHKGLFRGTGATNEITAVVTRQHDRVEAEFIGEPRPQGLAARILSPSGGIVTHFDRFYLPSITEVEYRIGDENHIVLNGACTPASDYDTRIFSVVSVKTRLPKFVVRPLVEPIALRIFAQDVAVLDLQTKALHKSGRPQYVSTELDIMGPHITFLMRRAERGEAGDPTQAPLRKEVRMRV